MEIYQMTIQDHSGRVGGADTLYESSLSDLVGSLMRYYERDTARLRDGKICTITITILRIPDAVIRNGEGE